MGRKFIKKGDTISEGIKKGIGSLFVLVPIAGNKTIHWVATVREDITTKPYLEDQVALVYTLNILDVMKSLAGVTLETNKIFNKVREAIGKKASKFSKFIYAILIVLIGVVRLRHRWLEPGVSTNNVPCGRWAHGGRSCRNDFVCWAGVESEGCSIMVLIEQFGAGWLVGGTIPTTTNQM